MGLEAISLLETVEKVISCFDVPLCRRYMVLSPTHLVTFASESDDFASQTPTEVIELCQISQVNECKEANTFVSDAV